MSRFSSAAFSLPCYALIAAAGILGAAAVCWNRAVPPQPEAVLATLAIVVWHLYWVLFDGHEYPMNTGWLIGKRLRHPSDKGSHHGHAKPAATPSENTPKP